MYKLVAFFFIMFFSTTALHAESKVAPLVNGVELQSEDSLYWLAFNEDADELWPMLISFWSNEGITLKREKPLLGYMDTDWTKDLILERVLSVILSDQAPERRERFRLRVERLADNKGTRVFINHSAYGILFDEEAVYTGYLPASPQVEIEMLSRLARYSGASEEQADLMVSSYSVQELTAERISADRYDIHIPGSMDFVGKKLLRALDRMDADIAVTSPINMLATFNKQPDYVDENAGWDIDDDSDLEETGFGDYTTGFAGSSEPEKLAYQFVLSEDKGRITISVSSAPDNTDKGRGLSRFSQTVAKNLQGK